MCLDLKDIKPYREKEVENLITISSKVSEIGKPVILLTLECNTNNDSDIRANMRDIK